MSRGPGALQRRILALLSEQAMTCPQLALRLFITPTSAESVAVRRAVRRLAATDKVRSVHPLQAKGWHGKWCAAWAETEKAKVLKAEWDAHFQQMMSQMRAR